MCLNYSQSLLAQRQSGKLLTSRLVVRIHQGERTSNKGKKMKDIVLSTLTGSACGIVFALLKLPVPAPPVISGLMGIVGLWAGYTLISNL